MFIRTLRPGLVRATEKGFIQNMGGSRSKCENVQEFRPPPLKKYNEMDEKITYVLQKRLRGV